MQKDSQERRTVVGGQREEVYNGHMGDKRFGVEGGARFHSGGIHVGGVRGGGSDSVTAEGAAPRVRAAKSSEFG